MDKHQQEEALRRFGRRLTYLRVLHNLTIAELGARSGIDPREIEQIESGEINFRIVPIINGLAQGLGIPPGELLQDM